MIAVLVVSASLLSGFGCLMPMAWVADVRALKLVVFLAWVALIAVSVLMGSLYPSQLMGANPLLKVGFESIALSVLCTPCMGSYRVFRPMVPRRMAWLPCSLSLIML